MRKALLLLFIASLSACSTVRDLIGEKPKAPPLSKISEAFKPLVLWQADAGSSSDDAAFVPAVDGNAIFTASGEGILSRFEPLKGKRIWKVDTLHKLSAGVGVGDNMLIVCAENGEVMAFDETGKPLWKFEIAGELLSVPRVASGVAIVRTGDGRIFGLDDRSGKQLWVYQYTTPALSIRSHAGVEVSQDTVFAGFAGGKLVSLDLKTGAVNWESMVAQPHGTTELERIADVSSAPVVDELQVCAAAFQGRIACFDIGKGELIWSRNISSFAGMIVDRRSFFVSDDQDDVLNLDSGSGATAWKQIGLSGRQITRPYVQGDYVVVGDRQGYVHFLRRSDGEIVARTETDGSPILGHPVYLNSDMFLVQTGKGTLYAIAAP